MAFRRRCYFRIVATSMLGNAEAAERDAAVRRRRAILFSAVRVVAVRGPQSVAQ